MSASSRIAGSLLLAVSLATGCARRGPPLELWLYYPTNLADSSAVAKLESVWTRAAAAGYRRVILADSKFSRLGEMDAAYFDRIARVRALAARLGLEIVPAVFPIGRSNGILALDPNLAEGLPVRNALFESRGGEARLLEDPPVRFPAEPFRRDDELRLEGGVAHASEHRGPARFSYRLAVARGRAYHISVQVRTRGYQGTPEVRVTAAGRAIVFSRGLGAERDQDWTTHHLAFHSFDHADVVVSFGAWRPAHGSVEWRDWRIEESGPWNVLQRVGAPFIVSGVSPRDVDPPRDPKLGTTPWRGQFDAWHEPVALRTRLPDGTRFRASWYQAAVVLDHQVTVCPAAPGLMPRLTDEAARVRRAFAPASVMMMHDEIRALNHDPSCRDLGPTPGTILARHVRACVGWLAGARVFVWSDLFDPFHNARRDDYLVNGDLAGSWEGLPPEVGIVNWNSARAAASARFFARRGHRQVIAGYYDGRPEDVRDRLRAVRGVSGVFAVMYTTWRDDYAALEAFAEETRRFEGRDVPAGPAAIGNATRADRATGTASDTFVAERRNPRQVNGRTGLETGNQRKGQQMLAFVPSGSSSISRIWNAKTVELLGTICYASAIAFRSRGVSE